MARNTNHRRCRQYRAAQTKTGKRGHAGEWAPTSANPRRSGGALQPLVAFAVIAATLLDPLHAAIAIAGLVGVVLIDAGMHAALASGFLGIFRIDGGREY